MAKSTSVPSKNKLQPTSKLNSIQGLGVAAIILILATWFTFQHGIKNKFVDWDDLKYTTENGCIQALTKESFKSIFAGECKIIMGNYHPLTILSLALNYKSAKFNPEAYHKTNLYLHIANILLLLLITWRLTKSTWAASLCAGFFALHPVHVESVIWAAERKDVLYTFFMFGAWWAWLLLQKSSFQLRTIVVSILFIAACLSKGMAVIFPALLLFTEGFLLSPTEKGKFSAIAWFNNWINKWKETKSQRLVEWGVYILIALIFGYVAIHAQDSQGGIREYPQYNALDRIVLAFYAFMHYLYKMIAPFELSAIYPYPLQENGWMPTKFYILALIGFITFMGTLISLRFTSWIALAIGGYLIIILPVLQLLPVGETIASDRYFYVSCIPLFMVIARWWPAPSKAPLKIISSIIAVAILGGWAYKSYEQVKVWNYDLSLFSHVIEVEPTASQAYNNVGIFHQKAKKPDVALPYYEEAVRLNPKYARAYSNMGACYYDKKDYKYSIVIYKKAIIADPTFADAWYNIGNSYYMIGLYSLAEKKYSRAIELNKVYYGAYYNRAVCKGIQGRHAEALVDYKIAAKGGNPQAQQALKNSGISWTDAPSVKLPNKGL